MHSLSDKKIDAQKNDLGISRGIYSLGYSTRDYLVWFAGATATMVIAITIGVKTNVPIIKRFAEALEEWHGKWHALTKKWLGGGPVISASIVFGMIIGHLAQIPGSVAGWRKAQTAINKYDTATAERNTLAKDYALLKEDHDRLNIALAESAKSRGTLADRVRTEPASTEVAKA